MALGDWAWALGRLRDAEWREVPFRVRQAGSRWAGRWAGGPWDALDFVDRPRWPIGGPLELSPSQRTELDADVDALLYRGFRLLGVSRMPEERTCFHWDPVAGASWPRGYTFDVPLRVPDRDIKVVWELGRLQHLQVLALGARELGRADAALAVAADLDAWIRQNPPFRGIHYASGVEVACRVVSFLVILGLLGDQLPGSLSRAVVRTLGAHGAWLERFPSAYSSANNHRIAELGAMVALGACASRWPGASRWLSLGVTGLKKELPRQISPDGVGTEHSFAYQAWTMEWVLVAARCAGWEALGDDVCARMLVGADFLSSMLDREGNAPSIGDDDGSAVLVDRLARERSVAEVAGLTLAMLHREDLLPAGWSAPVRARWFGVSGVRGRMLRRSRSFRGGYSVLRNQVDGTERFVWFDHGPLGFPALAAHGHADALAFGLHLGGAPVIVDSGTGRYIGSDRMFFRGTGAHATVRVDGLDQSRPRGPFSWARRAVATRGEVAFDAEGGTVTAQHDGYADRAVVHRRRLRLGPHALLVRDELLGKGRHLAEIILPLAPGLDVAFDRERWLVRRNEHVLLEIWGPVDAVPRVHHGGVRPGLGNVSCAYGTVKATYTLVFLVEAQLPWEGTTRIRFLAGEHAMVQG